MSLHTRETLRLEWTRQALADPDATLERASNDASFRSYWRARSAGRTWILMDAPPDKEDIRPWLDVAARLSRGPSMGLKVTKRMLNAEAHMSLGEAMQAEGWIQAECMKHPDYRESYEAFVAKRQKDFVKHWPGHAASTLSKRPTSSWRHPSAP